MRTARVAPLALAMLAAACSDDDDSAEVSSTTTTIEQVTTTSGPAAAVTTTSGPGTVPASAPATVPASFIEDTQAVGGTALYRVDLATGEAEPLGQVGTEVGVLGLTIDDTGGLIGLTDAPELITFTSTEPATLAGSVPVSGVEGSTLLALDRRAADGALLALGDAGELVTIDVVTGTATAVGAGDVPFTDPGIGLDVDPATATLVVTDASGSHRSIDTSTGTVTEKPPFAYTAGDVNAGAIARIVAVAVADDGTRYAIDSGTASLATLGADGVLTTVGPLGIDLTDGASFDIGPDGEAFLASPG